MTKVYKYWMKPERTLCINITNKFPEQETSCSTASRGRLVAATFCSLQSNKEAGIREGDAIGGCTALSSVCSGLYEASTSIPHRHTLPLL